MFTSANYGRFSLNKSFLAGILSKIRVSILPPILQSFGLHSWEICIPSSNALARLRASSKRIKLRSWLRNSWALWKWGLPKIPQGFPGKGKSDWGKIRQHRRQKKFFRQVSAGSTGSGAVFTFPIKKNERGDPTLWKQKQKQLSNSYFTQETALQSFSCGLDFYSLRSLMRSDDLYPFIQGNRRLQTVFNLIYPWNRKCITFDWSCKGGFFSL